MRGVTSPTVGGDRNERRRRRRRRRGGKVERGLGEVEGSEGVGVVDGVVGCSWEDGGGKKWTVLAGRGLDVADGGLGCRREDGGGDVVVGGRVDGGLVVRVGGGQGVGEM